MVTVSKETPKSNEVLIRLEATALNPIDWKMLHYGLNVEKWPATLGNDGSGTIEVVGDAVQGLKPGDEVLAFCAGSNERSAAFQEYAAINATYVAKRPKFWTFEDAATLPTGYLTAACSIYQGLSIPLPFLHGGLKDGFRPASILVLGGSSAVGAAALQLLRLALPDTVILTTSSEKHHKQAVSLGATKAFDYKSSNLEDQLRAASPDGKGVEAIIDATGGVAVQPSLLDLLIGPKEFAEVFTGAKIDKMPEGIKHHQIFGSTVFGTPGGQNIMSALASLLEEGSYALPISTKIVGTGFEAIGRGLEELKGGVSGTKLVVKL